MSKIPHPMITKSMERFKALPPEEKKKVRFIHLNHPNPAVDPSSAARQTIEDCGFKVANEMEKVIL